MENETPNELEVVNEPIVYDDDNFESPVIETNGNYENIKDSSVLLNSETGEIVDINTLSVFERIKYVSNKEGKTINDPLPSCKKCHGRGYTYIDAEDGIPTPCKCVFRDFYAQNPHFNVDMPSYNRKARKAMERNAKKKPVPNPALEKRQKRMNVLMIDKIKKMLAEQAVDSSELESVNESAEIVSEILENKEVLETTESKETETAE